MLLAHRRLLSSSQARGSFHIDISEEIKHALNSSKPVVSLESTIITHGLPFPQNFEMAKQVEQVVRDNGAIPATCAFIDGKPRVGLSELSLKYLAEQANKGKANKVSRRDIGYTMAKGYNGGTTIASTMILSHMAGIKVFATGGLGGVHKGGQNSFDVSADLTELGRTPVSVVCSGPKSILDIGLTLEFLETQGVFVGTYNDDGRLDVEVPGFYCRESGYRSPYDFSSFEEAASIIHNHNNIMSLNSGNIFCIPPPRESALSSSFISKVIDRANQEAIAQNISGKNLTPFLLSKIAEETNGKSVECNIKFVLNNARAATQIATSLSKLENNNTASSFQPYISSIKEQTLTETIIRSDEDVNTIIVGSIALDTIAQMKDKVHMNDSNIAVIKASVGGVGHNISLASHYFLSSKTALRKSKFVSIVGNDFAGRAILNQLKSSEFDASGILVTSSDKATAQYSATHDSDGNLVVAAADMSIIEEDFSEFVIDQVSPQVSNIVFDCNLSPTLVNKVMNSLQASNKVVNVIIEPTSLPKSSRIAKLINRPFPNNFIKLITPTVSELEAIHASFYNNDKYDDYDEWFPVLDSLGVDSFFRDKLNLLASKRFPVLKDLMDRGTLQQSFQLVPFFQNILIKIGSKGAIMVSLSENVNDYKSIPTTSKYKPAFILASEGRVTSDNKRMGVVIEYFPIPMENENLDIINVTGAGDSMLGTLVAQLSNSPYNWLATEINSVEQEWSKWEHIYKAQLASGLTLTCESAVSSGIQLIE